MTNQTEIQKPKQTQLRASSCILECNQAGPPLDKYDWKRPSLVTLLAIARARELAWGVAFLISSHVMPLFFCTFSHLQGKFIERFVFLKLELSISNVLLSYILVSMWIENLENWYSYVLLKSILNFAIPMFTWKVPRFFFFFLNKNW